MKYMITNNDRLTELKYNAKNKQQQKKEKNKLTRTRN